MTILSKDRAQHVSRHFKSSVVAPGLRPTSMCSRSRAGGATPPHLIQGSLLLLVLQFLDTHVLIILLYPHLHKSYTGRWCEQGGRQTLQQT